MNMMVESMGKSLQPHFADLKVLYAKALQDPENINVRVRAMHAAHSLVDFLEENDLRDFRDLVPLMITVLQQCVSTGAEAKADELLDVFSEIASHPYAIGEFIKKKLKPIGKKNLVAKIFTTMLDIFAADEAVSCGLISNLLERESKVDGDDDDEDEDLPGHLVHQTLDSLSLSVPAKHLNPVVFGICDEYIIAQDAKRWEMIVCPSVAVFSS
ncbi:Importin [Phytophthora megakarya]|uniref:Importin n=1 Tax=Phytophthora megakarya TaxID=4795 RepID=A0A225ULV4_9STRA|nr:Importin [Phytophthora megakarya]